MTVDPHRTQHRASYGGQTFYFCCAGCRAKFETDPDKYLAVRTTQLVGPSPAATSVASATAVPFTAPAKAATKYTCPMHPEIVRDRPGDCPICGMALEP